MSSEIQVEDLRALTLGSGLLACGGGGNPYYGQLVAGRVLRHSGSVPLVSIEALPSEARILVCGMMGAPLVGVEKPPSVDALRAGVRAVERSLGSPIDAVAAVEVGGAQCPIALIEAALTGRPLLDGDGMGRAFPEAQMCTFLLYGAAPGLPLAVSDDHGLLWRLPALRLPRALRFGGPSRLGSQVGRGFERLMRRYCARKGGWIYFHAIIDRASAERSLVRGSIRQALRLGRAIEGARRDGKDPIESILREPGGRLFFGGRIADVARRFRAGHDWGNLVIEGLDADRGRRAEVSFKNEYLVLWIEGVPAITVPDLISLVETESGLPLTTDVLRHGLRVSVVGLPCSELLRTPAALRTVGPGAFGYDLPFIPLA